VYVAIFLSNLGISIIYMYVIYIYNIYIVYVMYMFSILSD